MHPYQSSELKETRAGFGQGLLELGGQNRKVVALTADLCESVRMDAFARAYPGRFYQMGIAEANMISVAAGLATAGKIPFTGTFANFSTGRVYDQIRQTVAYSEKNVKICASHAGLSLGEDGATHQILEDIALMRVLPNMTVLVPCDFNQTRSATLAAAMHNGPVYLRFGRPKVPNFTSDELPFIIGKAQHLMSGDAVSIFASGHMVWKALEACDILRDKGIDAEVINIHTIKPLDEEAVIRSVMKTRCAVTAEEHERNGGLGDAIAQVLALHYPAPVEMVAVNDRFGESGKPDELLVKYGLDVTNVAEAALKAFKRKQA